MKKYILMLLAGVAMVALVACGQNNGNSSVGKTEATNQSLTFSQFLETKGTHIFFRTAGDEDDPNAIGYKDAKITMAMVFKEGKVTFYDLGYSLRDNTDAMIDQRDEFWNDFDQPTLGEMSQLSQEEQLSLLEKKHKAYYDTLLPLLKTYAQDHLERTTSSFNQNALENAPYEDSFKSFTALYQKVIEELSQKPENFKAYTPYEMDYQINLVTDGTGNVTDDEELILKSLNFIRMDKLPYTYSGEDVTESGFLDFSKIPDSVQWKGDFTFYLSSPVKLSLYDKTLSGFGIGSNDGFLIFQDIDFLIDQPDNHDKSVTIDEE